MEIIPTKLQRLARYLFAFGLVWVVGSQSFGTTWASNYGEGVYGSGAYSPTASPTPSPTSTPTPTVAATPTSAPASSGTTSTSPASAPTCTDTAPGATTPWLYGAVALDARTISLSFTAASNPVDHYALEYGTSPGNYLYGAEVMNMNGASQMTFSVEALAPGSTYYFRVRGGNGCATGPWSNEISGKTTSRITLNRLDFPTTNLEPSFEEKVPACEAYTVAPGDSLWSIAKQKLGDGMSYPKIIELNKDTHPSLTTSDKLTEGWELITACPDKLPEVETVDTKAAQSYKLVVKVTDPKKKPIADAKVRIYSDVQESQTNAEGEARFENIPGGQHRIEIAYKGYMGEQNIYLQGDSKEYTFSIVVEPKNVLLTKQGLSIFGVMLGIIVGLIILLVKRRRQPEA